MGKKTPGRPVLEAPGQRKKPRQRPTFPPMAVSSALEGLTSEFEMGSGVAPPILLPRKSMASNCKTQSPEAPAKGGAKREQFVTDKRARHIYCCVQHSLPALLVRKSEFKRPKKIEENGKIKSHGRLVLVSSAPRCLSASTSSLSKS